MKSALLGSGAMVLRLRIVYPMTAQLLAICLGRCQKAHKEKQISTQQAFLRANTYAPWAGQRFVSGLWVSPRLLLSMACYTCSVPLFTHGRLKTGGKGFKMISRCARKTGCTTTLESKGLPASLPVNCQTARELADSSQGLLWKLGVGRVAGRMEAKGGRGQSLKER